MVKSMETIAADLATEIVGIDPNTSRERGREESISVVSARRKKLDQRAKVEVLLLAFGRACVKQSAGQ